MDLSIDSDLEEAAYGRVLPRISKLAQRHPQWPVGGFGHSSCGCWIFTTSRHVAARSRLFCRRACYAPCA